jgi:hypothetical protein
VIESNRVDRFDQCQSQTAHTNLARRQGALGDAWLLGAMATIATQPALLARAVQMQVPIDDDMVTMMMMMMMMMMR